MKKKRPELLEIEMKPVFNGNESNEFAITVYNGTIDPAKHSIGIESNVPIMIMQGGKVLNPHERPSLTCETSVVSIPPATSRTFLFYWKDPTPELKEVRIRAMFKHAKTRWEGFV